MDHSPVTHSDPVPRTTDPEGERSAKTRSLAGKALLVFLLLMIALTWANTMLQEMTIATVTSASVQRGSLEKVFNASGSLTAEVSMPILVDDAARALTVHVTTGSSVAPGDALFTLDYTDIVKQKRDAVESAQETVRQKQRTLDWAIATLSTTTITRFEERQKTVDELYAAYQKAERAYEQAKADGAAPAAALQSDLSQAQFAYETEKKRLDADTTMHDYITKSEDLQSAKDSLADAERELADVLADAVDVDGQYQLTVTSSVYGSVTSNSVSVGSTVSTNAPVMMLSDLSGGLSLKVTVDEDTAGEMAVGDQATIGVGDQSLTCPILSISASPDRESMFDVQFTLSGEAGSVGMTATMRLRKRTQNYDVIIPLSALHSDSDGDFVYVVEQQDSSLGSRMSVRRVDVSVLDQDSSRAALQGGISQRDTIVSRCDRDIADGDRVRLEE